MYLPITTGAGALTTPSVSRQSSKRQASIQSVSSGPGTRPTPSDPGFSNRFPCPGAASIEIIPTLGPKVCKYDLLWAIWSPRDRARKPTGSGGLTDPSRTEEAPKKVLDVAGKASYLVKYRCICIAMGLWMGYFTCSFHFCRLRQWPQQWP